MLCYQFMDVVHTYIHTHIHTYIRCNQLWDLLPSGGEQNDLITLTAQTSLSSVGYRFWGKDPVFGTVVQFLIQRIWLQLLGPIITTPRLSEIPDLWNPTLAVPQGQETFPHKVQGKPSKRR